MASVTTASAPRAGTGDGVVVAGGGLVGGTLAIALARSGAQVTVLEAGPAPGGAAADDRPIALSYASRRMLGALDLWSALAPHAARIAEVHVSQRGHFGVARLRAGELGVPALGYVAGAGAMGQVLHRALATTPRVTLLHATRVRALRTAPGALELELAGDAGATLRAALLVAADGATSATRELLGIRVRESEYAQCALTALVRPRQAHAGRAWERFTADGPIALLPMIDGRCGLVWVSGPAQAASLRAQDDGAFLAALEAAFGMRTGGFSEVAARRAHPLRLGTVASPVAARALALGNAANALHPVAGQGLNLALRDVAALVDVLAPALGAGCDPGNPALLADYARARRRDQRNTVRFTDWLARGFTGRFAPLAACRAAGLLAMELSPALRRGFARRAMGFTGSSPALIRGIAPGSGGQAPE